MKAEILTEHIPASKVEPRCPLFGTCGGCAYQDIPYAEELRLKEAALRETLQQAFALTEHVFEPAVASPEPYHYRARLDIEMRRLKKTGEFIMGFTDRDNRLLVPIEACPIAKSAISDFLPELRRQAEARWPDNYRTANLVIKTGDDGRVAWGGIGRRSLRMKPNDYFWTEIRGKKIFYSLDTFFQANLSILPLAVDCIRKEAALDGHTALADLYSGVGLFGIALADSVAKVYLVEESSASMKLAEANVAYHGLFDKVTLFTGKVEEYLYACDTAHTEKIVAIVDPPRKGLSGRACEAIADWKKEPKLQSLFYLSCYPESLARDLKIFVEKGWTIHKVIPFDFFPKTRHLETLVHLKP